MILDALINTYTTGTQSDPSITALNDGGFVVSWQSIDQDGSSSGIFAQRYDVNGVAEGSEFRVNTYTSNSQGQPSIASLNDGGFVVSWKSFSQDGSNWGIYAQRYDASGLALGGEFLVNTHTAGLQTNPSIAALNDGGFVVSWTSDGQDGDSFGVYAQRYDANGIAQGNEFRVNTYITSEQSTSTIAVLNDGGFVVSWTSYGQDGSGYEIYAQRYDANGLTQGSEFRVNSTTFSDQHNQWIAALNDGGFVVSWMSNGQDGSEYGIFAQRYDASGVALGSEFRVNTYTTDHQVIPSITELNDGGFVISWSSFGQDGSDDGIYAQRYDSNGIALGSEFRVNTYTVGDQSTPSVTALNDGGFVVSWMSNGQDGSDWGVYGKRYDFNGNEIEWKQMNALPQLTGAAATLADGAEDTDYSVNATDLLAGWTDEELNTLSIVNLAANHGTVTDNGHGTYKIVPDANYNGPITLSYGVSDGAGNTAATLGFNIIAVNDVPTFAVGDGMVTTESGYFGADTGYSVTLQTDGKIVVAGTILKGTITNPYFSGVIQDFDFALIRYNNDGSLDTSFGDDGIVTTAIGPYDEYGKSVTIQTDGKILVAGDSWTRFNNGYDYDFALVRYNSDGSLDTSFDGDGRATTDMSSSNTLSTPEDKGNSVALQSDGKILVAGYSVNGDHHGFALARYNSSGILDASFDGDGKVNTAMGLSAHGNSVAIQVDGKILVAGDSWDGNDSDFAVVRYNSDGSLDTSFDDDGKLTTAVGSMADDGRSIALQADGKILVAGYSFINGNYDFALVRYNSDGSLDTSFDGDGKVTTAIGSYDDYGRSVIVQADGKILVAGDSYNGSDFDFTLVRYNSNGSLDTSFDGDGKVTTAISSFNEQSYSVTVQPDGKILVAGNSYVGGSDIALVRYNPDGSLDNTFDAVNTLNATPSYTENGSAVVLDNTVQVSDLELAAQGNYNGASISLVRHGGANSQDLFSGSGNLSFIGSNAILSGINIGTVSNSDGVLTLTFNSNATQALVDASLSALAYSNSSDALPASVQIDWTLSDGNTGAQGTGVALYATGTSTVNINSINDHIEVFEDSITTITFAQLLANDIDVYGASQTIVGIDAIDSRGSVVIDTVNQTITYSADADEFDLLVSGNSTTDTFKYILQGSTGETNFATVSINVVGVSDGIELFGTVNPDTLNGTNGEDVIKGGDGDDVISGGEGADELFGENGDDTLNGGNSIDFLFGGNGNDNLDGGAGDDFLYGGVGGDYMDGGDGVDTVSYVSSLVVIDVDLSSSGSQDWGAVGDIIVNVENLIGSDFNDRLSAAVAGSTIYGGLGSDTIYGDAGDDALYGDDGNDIFYAGGGDDTVYGGDGDDTIYSQGGSNLLIGGAGADSLNGFGGVAIASYSASMSAVNINLTTNVNTGGTAHGDTLSGVPNIIGSDFADTIIGDGFANDLFGGAGDDLLAGMGFGGNHMDGGDGIDTVSYADSLQVVNVDLAITTSQGWGASGDTIVDVENLIGSAFNDILKTTVSGSTIFGGDGNDTISGKSGSDVLLGESGNDIFYAGDGDDVILGGSGDDLIYSQGGYNILTGGGGADTLNGFTGIATASYADSSAAVNINMVTNINTGGDALGDILQGIVNVTGSAHSDSLTGDDKNNTLIGGVGNDTLTGGSGFDIFKYLADTDSGVGSGNRDIITDFNQSQGDMIDLLEIIDGDFIFMGINSLSGTANEIIYTQTGGNTVIGVDSNADGLAEFEIELAGLHTLEAADFQL